jgi:molybdopterin biosynthesis enzyme
MPLTELTLDEARIRLKQLITPMDTIAARPIDQAHGAILGQDIISDVNVPPANTCRC